MHGWKFSGPAILAGFVVLVTLLLSPAGVRAETEILRIRTGLESERTRIVFDLASSDFEYSRLEESDQSLRLLIAGVVPSAALGDKIGPTGRLEHAHIAREGEAGLVVSFQLAVPSRITTFTLDSPARLIVDFKPPAKVPSTPEPAPAPKAESAPIVPPEVVSPEVEVPEPVVAEEVPADVAPQDVTPPEVVEREVKPQDVTPEKQPSHLPPLPDATEASSPVLPEAQTFDPIPPPAGDRLTDSAIDSTPGPTRVGPRLVVIDAGHGGDDPGAVGEGLREKDVCLDVARSLHKELSARKGYHPLLSRSQDVAISLRQRMQFAEEVEADLFVSIHVNSAETTEAEGVEVFFLSLGGASDETARALAERENKTPGEATRVEPENEELPFSLSLRQSDTLLRSSLAAESVLDTFVKKKLAATRGVRQASFVVLKSYQVPSILVELGFVSSDRDREALKKASHRAALAQALADGIDRYFEEFAPSKRAFGTR